MWYDKRKGNKGRVNNLKERLIVIIGPTAVGKTSLSIELAKRFHGEIISGDSMQVYRTMDIGTAKITTTEMGGIPHHLIDIKNPEESFSVAEFQELARNKITEITNKGKIPIIVGGTGLYIQAVLYDYQFSDASSDWKFREEMETRLAEKGKEWLYSQLKQVDPASAERIHPNNTRRVIRALEVFHCTGKTMGEREREQSTNLLYHTALIGLTMDREQLYERINQRVDQMIAEGLMEEVKGLYDKPIRDCPSVQAIGYKELYEYFSGHVTLEEAIAQLKQNSRRYAKRQFTWFRNKMDVTWFDVSKLQTDEKLLSEILRHIEEKLEIKSNI